MRISACMKRGRRKVAQSTISAGRRPGSNGAKPPPHSTPVHTHETPSSRLPAQSPIFTISDHTNSSSRRKSRRPRSQLLPICTPRRGQFPAFASIVIAASSAIAFVPPSSQPRVSSMAFLPAPPLPFTPVRSAPSRCTPSMIRAPPARAPTVAPPVAPSVTSPTVPPIAAPSRIAHTLANAVAPVVPLATPLAPPAAPPLPISQPAPAKRAPRQPRRGPVESPTAAVKHELQQQPEFYYGERRARLNTPRKKRATKATPDVKKPRPAAGNDSIRTYLKEIGEVKLLDAETEINLAREISQLLALERISMAIREDTGVEPSIHEWAAASDMEINEFRDALRKGLRAKEHMVAANLRLVVSIAKKYMNRGLTFQDLIQEGSIGLIRGAEKFDGNKGFKFSTYATWWIRQAITRAIADHSRPIRLPVHVNDTIAAIRKVTKQLYNELNRPPSEEEVAGKMALSVEKLRFLSRSSRATISLETPIGRGQRDSSATLGSFIVWEGDTPEETAMKSLLREDLENVLNTLSPRERDVVRMRYGFDDGKMKTLEEIGSLFAVTRERIRQIEAKALRKLRHPNRNAVLREYIYEEQ